MPLAEHSVQSKYDKKAEVFNAFKTNCAQETQLPEMKVRDGKPSEAPIIQEAMASDLLCKLDTHKSMGLEGMPQRIMRELVKELTNPLSNIYQQS